MAGKAVVKLEHIRIRTLLSTLLILFSGFITAACGVSNNDQSAQLTPAEWTMRYSLNRNASGMIERYENIYNISVTSQNANPYLAEYNAGYVQGKLAGKIIRANRDNDIQTMPMQKGAPVTDINKYITLSENILNQNFSYSLERIRTYSDKAVREKLIRFIYRMLGMKQGASDYHIESLNFNGDEIFASGFFSPDELRLAYASDKATFMDIYFLNANTDLGINLDEATGYVEEEDFNHCSAFIYKTGNDLIIAHNTWTYLSNTIPIRINLMVNGDYLSMQSASPGLIYSQDDFGYNGKGIMFDETTVGMHGSAHPKIESLWSFWLAALAEFYSGSMDAFFSYISIDNSATYINGYQVADIYSQEFGLIEMDETTFYYFKPDGSGGYDVICKPDCTDKSYDANMLNNTYVFGFNYPVSTAIRNSLGYPLTPPHDGNYDRYFQFMDRINTITDEETAKNLITYYDEAQPISISSRWDLYTRYPMAGGTTVSKVVSSSMIKDYLQKQGLLEGNFYLGKSDPMWMIFGPPLAAGKPFIWSESIWNNWSHKYLPDSMSGNWSLFYSHVK